MTIHETHRRRSGCTVWTPTFRERRGTPLEGITMVVTVLSSGCPVHTLVQACGWDERMVADGRDRAGKQCHQVHEARGEQGHRDVVPVQADRRRVKGRTMRAWMGLAMMGSTRRWVAGTVSVSRDTGVATVFLYLLTTWELQITQASHHTDVQAGIDRAFQATRQLLQATQTTISAEAEEYFKRVQIPRVQQE
jgi:hypothetical protein